MPVEPTQLDDRAKDAVIAATDAAHAVEVARQTQLDSAATSVAHLAADLASERVASKIVDEGRMAEIVRTQMSNILRGGSEKERELILARVPYVCIEITNTNKTLQEMQAEAEAFREEMKEGLRYVPLTQKLVFGFVSLVLVAVTGALIALVVIK